MTMIRAPAEIGPPRGAGRAKTFPMARIALMKKKMLFVGLTMVGTLYTSCVGTALIWLLAGGGLGLFAN